MARSAFPARNQWLPIASALVFTAALTALLAWGLRRASDLQAVSSALQQASELSTEPQLLRTQLTLLQRGLESKTYVGESLRSLNTGRDETDTVLAAMEHDLAAAGLAPTAVGERLTRARQRWAPIAHELSALEGITSAGLYADTASGSELTPAGTALKRSVDALLGAQAATVRGMTDDLTALSGGLRAEVIRDGGDLRVILVAATALAAAMLAMMLYFAWTARRSAATAVGTQRQIDNILGTVREGLFLIGRDGRLAAAHSASLTGLLANPAPSGEAFEDLLRPLVSEKTLAAAVKFVNLMWKEKVNQELIESVNPLSQIEVSFARAGGRRETRWLSFAFRRARDDASYVLGVVADITDRVTLQQELEQLRTEQDASGDMLLQLLKIDEGQLALFLSTADAAFRHCNALLSDPGATAEQLRAKLDGVFRELHSIKGEAAALGLEAFASRLHATEDLLAGLREQTKLNGDDFVPVVTRLDELLSYAADLREVRERIGGTRGVPTLVSAPDHVPRLAAAEVVAELETGSHTDNATRRTAAPGAANAPGMLEGLLRALVAEVGRACGRSVQLRTEGLERIPPALAPRVKEITLQMIRNSIAHGIEAPEQRAAAGKNPGGTIRVAFSDEGAEDYTLLVEDDGQGLSYEQILNRALQRGLVSPQQAMGMDRAGVFRLIFSPGFSTADRVSEHAGRGVGLDLVNAAVRTVGGRIGISTSPGQFTRFKVLLPRASQAQSSAA